MGAVRYVALGDSYTIGTSVSEVERWPNQLVERLRLRGGVALELVANLGVIRFVSIDSVADQVATDRSLVARDGLHPSGAQYAGWVELIAPVVAEAIAMPLGQSSG